MSANTDKAISRYVELMGLRPDLFPMRDNIVTDAGSLSEYANSSGKQVGVVYESPWHYLVVDVVKTPDGLPGHTYERYVSTSDNPGSVAVPVLSDGRICLLRNYRHMLGKEVLELPRGIGVPQENQLTTAARELAEELGAEALSCRLLGYVVADSGITGDRVAIVRVDIGQTDVRIGHEGISGYVALSRDELAELVSSGEIEDAFTLSALCLTDVFCSQP